MKEDTYELLNEAALLYSQLLIEQLKLLSESTEDDEK